MHRVAMSDTYAMSVPDVRRMPFRDLVVALLMLDYVGDVRQEPTDVG